MVGIVVLAPSVPDYLSLAFGDGRTPLEYLEERLMQLCARIAAEDEAPVELWCACGPAAAERRAALPDVWRDLTVPSPGDASALLHALDDGLPAGVSDLVLVQLDSPLFSPMLAHYLLSLQRYAVCDYTFGDGYPAGFAVQVLRRDVLGSLAALAAHPSLEWTREVVFDTLSRDINAFDVETEAARNDLDLLRLSLTVDSRANYLYCRRLLEDSSVGVSVDRPLPDPRSERFDQENEPILVAIEGTPGIRRTLPFYVQVQLTSEMTQRPFYTPWADDRWAPDAPGHGTHMPLEKWVALVDELAAWAPESTLSIGYRGEVGLHPDLPAVLQTAADAPSLRLFVETSGCGWSPAAIEALTCVDALIVELDALRPEQYQRFRGSGYEEAMAFVDRARQLIPGRVHVQATRMQDNEWDLQEFFQHWDAVEGVTPLIQKYNDFAGRLPRRQVADMAPIHRIPCWHLQRDLVVLVDGTVVRCLQDLDAETRRGRIGEQSLQEIWDAGHADMAAHHEAVYPTLCETCDEYYTFNA